MTCVCYCAESSSLANTQRLSAIHMHYSTNRTRINKIHITLEINMKSLTGIHISRRKTDEPLHRCETFSWML